MMVKNKNGLSRLATWMVAFLWLLSAQAFAAVQQSGTVKGTVTDTSGEPLIGVSVMVKGTAKGVVTDLDGHFSLQVSGGETMEVSYIGYQSQTFVATIGKEETIVLHENPKALQEVVVVGYGVQKKSDVTGSIASINQDALLNVSTDNVGKAIQGKVSGVQVVSLSGAPGSETHFRVRGYSSNGTSNPLYIVDGLKVTDISNIAPENIKSIEILKDAASAAIYGAEAGNGVVLITTNSGTKGKTRIFYNGQYSIQSVQKQVDMMNAQQFKDFWTEAGYDASAFQNGDTNWQDELFETGYLTQHTLGVEGGNDNGLFFLSLNYLKNNGMIVGDKDVNRRVTGQVNASYKIKEWLTVGTTNSLEYRKLSSVAESIAQPNKGPIGSAYLYDPTVPVTYANDSDAPTFLQNAAAQGMPVMRDAQGHLYGTSTFITVPSQPHGELALRDAKDRRFQLNGTVYANITPIKNLVFTSRLGYRLSSTQSDCYAAPYWWSAAYNRLYGGFYDSIQQSTYYQWENFANYTVEKGSHSLNAMLGTQYTKSYSRNVIGNTDQLVNEAENFHNLSAATASSNKSISGGLGEYGNTSWFGRLGWTYDERYILHVNFRADAYDLSKLSKKSRWGYFPSVSLGWVMSNEKFMQRAVSPGGLSFLKLRGSWGVNGNVNSLGGFAYASSMVLNSSSGTRPMNYTYLNETFTGATPSNVLPNEDLKWERSTQIDLGLEARFLRDRLSFAADYYHKITTDLLTTAAAPAVSGASIQFVNMGKIKNDGLDLELSWKDNIGKLKYSISGNISFLKNEVLESPYGEGRYAGGGGYFTDATYFEKGYPIWYFRTYIVDHIDQMTGMPVYKTAEQLGSDDGKADVGSAIPDYTYGMTLTAEYEGFDLRVFGNGAQGNKLYWALARLDPTTMLGNLPTEMVKDYWSWTNTDGTRPSPQVWAKTRELRTYGSSNHMVFNASYFAIKQIQLGYTLPKKWVKPLSISNLRLYCDLENFFVFTKYPGNSPETMAGLTEGESSASMGMKVSGGMGVDRLQYPSMKQVVFGVNLSF